MSALDAEFYSRIPKADLHRHLEGALRPVTLWEFHQNNQLTLFPDFQALVKAVQIPKGFYPGFKAFLDYFPPLRFPYGKLNALDRIARECVLDAGRDGVAHLEIRFSPVFWARRVIGCAEPLPTVDECERASEALIRGAQAEAARQGLTLAFICCLGRHFGAEGNRPATELLKRPIGALFDAVDVAGDEVIPLSVLDEPLNQWRDAGKWLTLHAGECSDEYGGLGAKSVREAIEVYGAQRIGHGIRAIEDPAVVELLRGRGIALEVCLTSNVQTRSANSYEEHPLRKLVQAGVNVTLNSDDPSLSDCTLSEEYGHAHEKCGLTVDELRALAINTIRYSLQSQEKRDWLVRRVEDAFACL